jgi:predicted transcriptional regulator
VDDLMDRAFGGSAMQLVMRALSGRQTSETDLAEIRRLLDEHDGDKR